VNSVNKEYAIIVRSKTRLEALIERFNTKAQTKFYIESLGSNYEDYEKEHEIFYQSLSLLQTQLSKLIKHKTIDRSYLPSYIFNQKNIIVVIGQDGLVANTAKYSKSLPMVAVNPDKSRYDGILLPFDTGNFLEGIESVLASQQHYQTVTFAEVKLNDGQRLLAFNDLFIGPSSHVSARYKISYNGKTEEHSSSGLIVSTSAGSTGWLSSIFNMAYGISDTFKPKINTKSKQANNKTELRKTSNLENTELQVLHKQPKLSNNELLFAVREPFKSIRTQTNIVAGIINSNSKLVLESLMPTGGIIFSDGVEKDFINFNSGSIATIGLAAETANLVKNTPKEME
jgi:NAD kinase